MGRRVVLFPTNRIHLLVDLRAKKSAENLKKPKQSVFLGSHFGELVAVWLARTSHSFIRHSSPKPFNRSWRLAAATITTKRKILICVILERHIVFQPCPTVEIVDCGVVAVGLQGK